MSKRPLPAQFRTRQQGRRRKAACCNSCGSQTGRHLPNCRAELGKACEHCTKRGGLGKHRRRDCPWCKGHGRVKTKLVFRNGVIVPK